MGAVSGKDGSVKVGAVAVGYLDNFTLNINGGTAECSALGAANKAFIPTQVDWSGSASGAFDPEDVQQGSLLTMFSGATALESVALELVGGKKFSGNALITSIAIGNAVGDKVTFSFNFQGTGPLTIAAITA